MSKISQRLDAVSKAKQAYVLARTTLEQTLRERMRDELANLQTQIDISVRYAIDSGESKAGVMRALGTKDYNTVKASLERTSTVAEVVGADPLYGIYYTAEVDGKRVLYVDWENYGSEGYSGQAVFDIKTLDNGNLMFIGREPLWNEDYTIRNDAIALLDGKVDGPYYEEVVGWLAQ